MSYIGLRMLKHIGLRTHKCIGRAGHYTVTHSWNRGFKACLALLCGQPCATLTLNPLPCQVAADTN